MAKDERDKVVDMSAYEIAADDTKKIGSSNAPSQNITEAEKTPQWYVDNIKYYVGFYNTKTSGAIGLPNTLNSNASNTATTDIRTSPVQDMIKYMQYYLGEQQNLDYNHLTQNVSSSNLQAVWIKGQKIATLVDSLVGSFRDRLSNAEWTAKLLSKDAVSERTSTFDSLMLKHLLKPTFDRLAQQGAEFNPGNGAEVEFPEDAQKWMDKNYKEKYGDIAAAIAQGTWFSDYWFSKLTQAARNLIIAGVAGMEHCVDNGKTVMKPLMPYNLILDTRVDEDYNRDARFRGKVESMTPTAIFKKWPELSQKQRDDIQEMATDSKLGESYNTNTNLKWWMSGSVANDPVVTTVTMYWLTIKDPGIKKKNNSYGNMKVVKTTTNEKGDYELYDICKGTLIGNRYLVDFGYIDNLVESYTDKAVPEFPIQVFIPNMTLGVNKSVVARLHRLQDEIDAYEFKVREMIGAAKGKAYFVHGWKLGGAVSAQEMMNDLSSIGIHVLTHDGEQMPDMSDGMKIIETVDLTLDPNIAQLYTLIKSKESALEEIASMSKISMGQQQFYVGQSTQQASIAQTNLGIAYLVDGYLDFVQQNMQYSANVTKGLWTIDDSFDAAVTIGDKGRKYLQITKEFRFQDFLIFLSIRDTINQEAKQRLLTIAQALAQNQLIDMIDFIEIETATTFTEIKALLEYSVRKKKREADKKAAYEQMLQATEAEKNRQLQGQVAQGQQQAILQANQDKIQGQLANTVLKEGIAQGGEVPQGNNAAQAAQ